MRKTNHQYETVKTSSICSTGTKKSAKKYRLHQWMWTTDALTTDSGKWLDVGTCI